MTNLPDGFTPCYAYPCSKYTVKHDNKVIDPTRAIVGENTYNITTQLPILPLKLVGKAYHTGWDIPTLYAIDANNQVWKSSAHGSVLAPAEVNELLADMENEEDRNDVRKSLGLKEEQPSWVKSALANGWTPPTNWENK